MFSKRELLLFVFSWIKTFKRSFFVFLKYFWWLTIINIILRTKIISIAPSSEFFTTMAFFTVVVMLSVYFSILSIRSSVETKSVSYFMLNTKKLSGFTLLFLTAFVLLSGILSLTSDIGTTGNWALSTFMYGINLFLQGTFAMLLITTTFFLLDNTPPTGPNQSPSKFSNIIKALSCSLKGFYMHIIPFAALLALYMISYYSTTFILSFLPNFINVANVLFLNFFFTCAVAVLYTKIRHNNFKLLFAK